MPKDKSKGPKGRGNGQLSLYVAFAETAEAAEAEGSRLFLVKASASGQLTQLCETICRVHNGLYAALPGAQALAPPLALSKRTHLPGLADDAHLFVDLPLNLSVRDTLREGDLLQVTRAAGSSGKNAKKQEKKKKAKAAAAAAAAAAAPSPAPTPAPTPAPASAKKAKAKAKAKVKAAETDDESDDGSTSSSSSSSSSSDSGSDSDSDSDDSAAASQVGKPAKRKAPAGKKVGKGKAAKAAEATPAKKKPKVKRPRAPSAYILFCKDERARINADEGGMSKVRGEAMRVLGQAWSEASPEVKQKYQDLAAKLKEKFNKDKAAAASE